MFIVRDLSDSRYTQSGTKENYANDHFNVVFVYFVCDESIN